MRFPTTKSHVLISLAGVLLLSVGLFWYNQQEKKQSADQTVSPENDASVLSAESDVNANLNLEIETNSNQTVDLNANLSPGQTESEPAPAEPEPVETDQPNYIESAHLAEFIDGQPGPAASSFKPDSRLLLVLATAVAAGQKVESKISVEKARGGRIGSEQTIQLYDGEIVIANPGRAGDYAVIIRVGESETRRVEFSVK